MKGIILSGGKGSRLYPVTKAVCKQLLPIYDKPMIYYPLSVLMMAQITDIMLISTPKDKPRFQDLLGDGTQWGIHITYAVQTEAVGIANAFVIAEEFIGNDPVALILGDNIFYGESVAEILQREKKHECGAMIFGYEVQDPERYGVIEFDSQGDIANIIEKPQTPPSRYAVTGLYFYDSQVVGIAKSLKPSARGEYEITDVNKAYLNQNQLQCHLFGRGVAWLDTGTPQAMQRAASYVQTIQERQGIKIGCVEEIAYQMGTIDEDQLLALAKALAPSDYATYLKRVVVGITSVYG